MKPLVSVILPYRDSSEFLEEAIASVEQQTLRTWQLLLVDDHSADGGPAIADRAAARDARIKALRQPAGVEGAAAARNFGLVHATGDLVAFLDADDRFFPDKLDTEASLMARFPEIGLTWGATIWWHPGHSYRDWSDCPRELTPGVYLPPLLLDFALLLQRSHVPSLCGIMVRKIAIPPEPAFEPGLALYEDQSFIAKVLCNWPAYVGSHRTALYRQHRKSGSAMAEEGGTYERIGPHPARLRFLAWLRAYLEATPKLAGSTAAALRMAEAVQSGDRSKLSPTERRELALAQLQLLAKKPARRVGGWMRRRWLQLLHRCGWSSDHFGRPF